MTLGIVRDRKKTAGDLTVSKHIIIVPARKTATGPDLTERERENKDRESRDKDRRKRVVIEREEDKIKKSYALFL